VYSYIYWFYLVCSSKLIALQITFLAFVFLLILFLYYTSLYLRNILVNLICFGFEILSLIFWSLQYANFYLNVKLVLLFVKDLEIYFDVGSLHLLKPAIYYETDNFLQFFNMHHYLRNFGDSCLHFLAIILLNLYNFDNKYFVNPFEFSLNLISIIKAIAYNVISLSYFILKVVSKQEYGFIVFKNFILKFYIIIQSRFCISLS